MSDTVRFRGFLGHCNGLDGALQFMHHEFKRPASFHEAIIQLFHIKWRLTARVRGDAKSQDIARQIVRLLRQVGIPRFEISENEVAFKSKLQIPIVPSREVSRMLWLAGSGVFQAWLSEETASVSCEVPMTKIFVVSIFQIVLMNIPMLFVEVPVRNKLIVLYSCILLFFVGIG
jgi:hypothetical protein